MVIGIGVKFPFLSYRASSKNCQLMLSSHEKLKASYRRTEECIRQRDCIYFCHRRIIDEVWIDEEENRHINSLASVEPLLLETKALDLAEIRSHLCWSDTVGSDSNNVFRALIRCREERKRCLPWQNSDLSLLWGEFPRHYIRH